MRFSVRISYIQIIANYLNLKLNGVNDKQRRQRQATATFLGLFTSFNSQNNLRRQFLSRIFFFRLRAQRRISKP